MSPRWLRAKCEIRWPVRAGGWKHLIRLKYNGCMISRVSHRSGPLSERALAGLAVLLAHGLLLIRLASTQEPGEADGRRDPRGSMEVTFITLAKPTSRAPSSLALSISPVSRAVDVPKIQSFCTGPSGAIDNPSVERSEQLASDSRRGRVAQGVRLNEGLKSQYEAALRAAIERKWQQLGQSPVRGKCTLQFTQSAGGVVTSATTEDCELLAEDRSRLEAAVLMAQPLPYKGYESVFSTDIEIKF